MIASKYRNSLLVWVIAGLLGCAGATVRGQEPAPAAAQSAGQASTPESQSPEKAAEVEDPNEAYRQSPAVKALGSKLGMSPAQAATAFTVANFVILALMLGWFLLRSLPKVFRDRNTAIQKHLGDARAATEEASSRLSGVEDRLGKLDEQIAALRSKSEKDLLGEEQRIKASVEDEKRNILASAEQEIAAATAQARRQIQQYAADLAIEQAAKKLVVSAETDRLLIQNFARRLTGDDDKGGQN